MENMSLSDIAAVTKDNDDYFGNGGMWIFALLILMMMGGGFWNRCNQSEPVTEAGLCNSMNFNGLENSVGRLNDSLQHDYMGLQNGISSLGYETLRNFNETQNRISDCCCITQRGIDGVNYNGASIPQTSMRTQQHRLRRFLTHYLRTRLSRYRHRLHSFNCRTQCAVS